MVSLLRNWPDLPAIHALELLDYCFPDPAVRSFTIRCLRNLRYPEICFYFCIHQMLYISSFKSIIVCQTFSLLGTQWWWTAAIFNPAGSGPEVWVLLRMWPHYFPAREGFVQQKYRTLPVLASQVRPSLAERNKIMCICSLWLDNLWSL